MSIDQAYALGQRIETVHAMDRARLLRDRGRKTNWRDEYDPMAATELAELIYRSATA